MGAITGSRPIGADGQYTASLANVLIRGASSEEDTAYPTSVFDRLARSGHLCKVF